jgi:hypothetical protein
MTAKRAELLIFPDDLPDNPDDELWRVELQATRVRIKEKPFDWTEGEDYAERFLQNKWEVTLYWVHKLRWNPRLKIPVPRGQSKEVKLLKPFAEVCIAWINLCWELHGLGFGRQYQNAAHWFRVICWELQTELYASLFHGEKSILDARVKRSLAGSIDSGVNPFEKDREHKPAQWEVGNAVLQTRKHRPLIFKELWKGSQRPAKHKGLAAALRSWQTSTDRAGHQSFGLKDGAFIVSDGRGKFKVLAPAIPVQKSIAENMQVSNLCGVRCVPAIPVQKSIAENGS